MNNWYDIEALYYKESWKEFVAAARTWAETHPKEPLSYFTMVSSAYKKLGDSAASEAVLREGIRRKPEDSFCYALLGDCLARQSTGNPEKRAEAIRLWRRALELQKKVFHSTHNSLIREIPVLEALPADAPYPPVAPATKNLVAKLQSCGLFHGRSVDNVVAAAITQCGADIAFEPPSRSVHAFLGLDSGRYLFSGDWRFSAGDFLEEIAKLVQSQGVSITFRQESEIDNSNARDLDFVIQGKRKKVRVDEVAGIVSAVNSALDPAGHRFYQLDRKKCGEESIFMLLRETEAKALRKLKFVTVDLP